MSREYYPIWDPHHLGVPTLFSRMVEHAHARHLPLVWDPSDQTRYHPHNHAEDSMTNRRKWAKTPQACAQAPTCWMTVSPDDAVTSALGLLVAMATADAQYFSRDALEEAHVIGHHLMDTTDPRGMAWALADIVIASLHALGHDPIEFCTDYAMRVAQKIADNPDPRGS